MMLNLRRRFPAGGWAFVRLLSTEVKAVAAADRLYRRLSPLGHIKGTVGSVINEYIREGKTVPKSELEACIKELRKYKRFHHALEIMEWMEVRKFNFAHKDYAMRLQLTAKAKGIAAAENYLSGLPPSAKVPCTYAALLYCYCDEKMTDKALDIFAKMTRENTLVGPLPFNNLMSLYMKIGQPEKVAILAEEMKKMNIRPDTFHYNLLMHAYSHLNDIEGVERVFEEMKLENGKVCNWTSYSNLAQIYIKGGYKEKALLALRNLEKEMSPHDREAYHFLISLYAGISDLHHVHRIWNLLKSTVRVVTNKSYLLMLQSLKNLNDINGVKKCYEEWESVCSNFDVRLTNTAIGAYLAHDMLEEAESALQNAVGRSSGNFFIAWEMFMIFYLRKHQIEQALSIMENATSKVRDDEWRPKVNTVDKFLSYFKQEGDVSGAEEFYKLMKRIKHVDSHLYQSLLETYVAAGKTQFYMRARIEDDGSNICLQLFALNDDACKKLFLILWVIALEYASQKFKD